MRVIVCGSRTWSDFETMRRRLQLLSPDAVLVHGAARGADQMAAGAWLAWGNHTEPHPADWDRHGKGAGHRRNAEMAKLGADLCLAFRVEGKSNGTDDMVRRARAAGIATEVIVIARAGVGVGRT